MFSSHISSIYVTSSQSYDLLASHLFLFKDIYSKSNDFNEKPKTYVQSLVGKFC
jgi:hypothetical protein